MSLNNTSSREVSFRLQYFFILITCFPHFAQPLSFNITQFYHGTTNIVYEGDAAPVLGGIELNAESTWTWTVGRATYADPLHLWDSNSGSLADFVTHFTFNINAAGQNHSDGFAFFLAPVGVPIPLNSGGGFLGLFNSTTMSDNKIASVEFDTYSNSYWDPAGPHVGINIDKIASAVQASWNFSSDYNKKNVNVWIIYNATTKNLSVFWTNKENPVFVGNSSLSYVVDLRKCLPDLVTIGFSAATGQYPERHTIYSWDFNSSLDPTHEKNRKHKWKGNEKWLIAVFAASFLIVAIGVAALCCLVKRIGSFANRNHSSNGLHSISAKLERLAVPKRFSYQELVVATNDFAKERRLGQGGSGQVYKGILQDIGCLVAVKRILTESERYEKIFINEVKIISHLFHRNLVQFIGWCHKNGECLLVYAYMSNGSLDTHLFGSRVTLQWESRYKIALGLASALHYLHEEAEQCVLHRDIKSANVLLDNNFSTKLGDFGIAKLVDPRFRSQTTGVVGTFGYMAPEYASGGRASKESDIYSLGVVALEIACGRRTYQDGEYHVPLFRWVWQLYLAGNLLHVADERLNLNFDRNEMECLLFVGLWCTHPRKTERPKAGQVIKVLQLEAPLPELPPDMHDHYPLPQPQQEADSASHISLTSSLDGR
ncbi:hypothetical protein FF1_042747 [Malus domestica]